MTPSANIFHYDGLMGRWEPDAKGRLQQAAVSLFIERGYAAVTVAEIAERAGLTKRSFFNHFTDKREVLFAGADDFEASVIKHIATADPALEPIDAAMVGLTNGGLELAGYSQFGVLRRDLIASSPELQERDLIKMASLTAAIADALGQREVPATTALLTARAAIAVFTTAWDDWISDPAAELPDLMDRSLDALRHAVGAPAGSAGRPRRRGAGATP